jgi:hypothetical protein
MIRPDGKCSHCGEKIPDGVLSCRACAIAASWASEWARQFDYLPRVEKGDLQLRLARPAGERTTHIMLFGSESLTYCAMGVAASNRRQRLFLEEAHRQQSRICRACMDKLTAAINEGARGAA